MKIFPSRYFLRLTLFTVFLSALPVIFVGFFSYYKASETIQQKVGEGNDQILLQTQMRVEQLLGTIDKTLKVFMNSPLLNSALQYPLEPARFQTFLELSLGLSQLQTYELGIKDIYMVNLHKNWMINNRVREHVTDINNLAPFNRYVGMPTSSFWIKPETGSSPANDDAEACIVHHVNKLPINLTPPVGLLVAEVPCSRLNQLTSQSADLGQFIILDSQNRVLSHTDPFFWNKDLSSETYISQLNAQEGLNGSFIFGVDGHESIVTYRKSEYNDWKYVSIVSIEKITKDSEAIGWLTLYTCIGIFFVVLLISLQGSRKLYLPIRKLYETARNAGGSENTGKGKDEFHFINESIVSLLNNRTEMSNQIRSQFKQLKDFFVLKLFQGDSKESEIKEQIDVFGFPSAWHRLSVMAVQIDTLEGTRYSDNDKDLLMFAINNIAAEVIPQERRLSPIVINQSQLTVVIGQEQMHEEYQQYIDSIAEQLQAAVKHYLQLKVSVGVSRPFTELKDTPRAYREGLEALKYRIRLGYEAILYIEDLEPGQQSRFYFPERVKNELIDAIKLGDERKIDESFNKLITAIFDEGRSYREYQLLLSNLIIDLMTEFQGAGETIDQLYQDRGSIFDDLSELTTKQEIIAWLKQTIIDPVADMLNKRRDIHYSDISEQIKRTIHEHYDSDITLEFLSSRINYHPNYIKRVFRQETGVNFSEYLSEYRLKIAKKWLLETDMKISEIADRLRYNNSQNFIRYFRKAEGITPGEFRKQGK